MRQKLTATYNILTAAFIPNSIHYMKPLEDGFRYEYNVPRRLKITQIKWYPISLSADKKVMRSH